MSDDECAPTNKQLRADLGKIAYDQTRRSRANTCYAASERIFELAEAAERLAAQLVRLTWIARTSGGVAGPDSALMTACQGAEDELAEWRAATAASADAPSKQEGQSE